MEFRGMRRGGQALSREACEAVLARGTSGVLAVAGDGGYPYAVPLSYVYQEGKVYIHCAVSGHKLDAVRRCPKVSFCVIDQDQVVPERYTTYFRSVILFGTARVLEDPAEIRRSIELLALRYAPEGDPAGRQAEIEGALDRLCMLEITAGHLTGKEAVELARAKK